MRKSGVKWYVISFEIATVWAHPSGNGDAPAGQCGQTVSTVGSSFFSGAAQSNKKTPLGARSRATICSPVSWSSSSLSGAPTVAVVGWLGDAFTSLWMAYLVRG